MKQHVAINAENGGCPLRDQFIFRILRAPGLWLQNITTRKPEDRMVEVAIVALKEAFGDKFEEMQGKEYVAEAIG